MKSIEEKIVLSKDDCNFLIDYFESSLSRKYTKSSQYKKGGVHAIVDYSHIPKDFFEKLKVFNVIPFNFNFEIDDNQSLVIHKYEVGEYFESHSDTSLSNYGTGNNYTRVKRIKTLLFQLSDENEYSGGDFIVDSVKINKKIGNCVSFDSKLFHEVTPIISGIRYSATIWIEKENMILPRKFI